MSMSKVLELARAELGQHEDPAGSNLTKYGFWYGVDGVPWCVIFLCWLFNEAGERMAFFGGGRTASCSTLLRWYMEQGQMYSASEVQMGDIVLLNFHGGKDPEHCGLVESVARTPTPAALVAVNTIEGNTTPGEEGTPQEQANGGCVALKTRFLYQIVGVCRPQYKEEEAAIPDYAGRWSEAYWEEGRRRGIITEAKDGKYRPTDKATREEVLAMILRNDEYHRKNG